MESKTANAIEIARRQQILLPTFQQLRYPESIPENIKDKLSRIGLWDIHPLNLFRIHWQNESEEKGGIRSEPNILFFPSEFTGIEAKIAALVGKWFPTGAHKVGATYGCLVPRLVQGEFDPVKHKAAWPSTGNFCRGGAFNSRLMGCRSIAILPEQMSQERFDWLKKVTSEVLVTPGGEANVKEIYDRCKLLVREDPNVIVFNQFEDFGNYLWHYWVTGTAFEKAAKILSPLEPAGLALTSGSAGTLASGDYLKKLFPDLVLAAAEPVQCPTLALNGYGDHLIEGIGDKHVPWIHNVRSTDAIIGVNHKACLQLLRLFNEPAGKEFLQSMGLANDFVSKLSWLGISGVANLLASIKLARYFEFQKNKLVFTVLTDSVDLYRSRLQEMRTAEGELSPTQAAVIYHRYLLGAGMDHVRELGYYDRKRIHNLKYFTWVEQQGKSSEELTAQWHNFPEYFERIRMKVDRIDEQIMEFNRLSGVRI